MSVMLKMVASYFVVLFCFFFKQKTAYEMRISDWSSDVCSSDLQREGIAVARQRGAYRGRKRSLSDEMVAELHRRVDDGERKAVIARDLGISRETLYQYLRAAT